MSAPLTHTEAAILECLTRAAGQPVFYRELIREVYGRNQGGVRLQAVIRRHVSNLRTKVDVPITRLSLRWSEGGYRLAIGPEPEPPPRPPRGPYVELRPWAEAVQAKRRRPSRGSRMLDEQDHFDNWKRVAK